MQGGGAVYREGITGARRTQGRVGRYGCMDVERVEERGGAWTALQFGWRLSLAAPAGLLTLDTRGASDSLLRHSNAHVHGIALSASAARHVCRSYDADAAPLAGYIGTPSSAGAETKTWCYRLRVAGTHRGRHYRAHSSRHSHLPPTSVGCDACCVMGQACSHHSFTAPVGEFGLLQTCATMRALPVGRRPVLGPTHLLPSV